ncbi:molybdate ABC transporter substrate-binding protein [Neptunicella marina]|uniref:Molybdate ABC transporter substrate-binding protein n=1 Tax=Neptunicella marina TaxID=2125989 RepID=A0A8J6IXZ6_9ALTE|nr:molybdate ABC transporter substrate-binding protein [Neptunicella marina]MBC3767397.1 molybdate ABC transporter substrate-binding protein [Neptunicella marina]
MSQNCLAENEQVLTLRVAVAANFSQTLRELIAVGDSSNNQQNLPQIDVVVGSTGTLYAQIVHGAPFDIFLAANVKHPAQLEQNGLIAEHSRHTYAVGQLAFWCPSCESTDEQSLKNWQGNLAIANPTLAPYGEAAIQVLQALNLADLTSIRLVQGNNVAQAFQFIDSGNTLGGFVAASQVMEKTEAQTWLVPHQFYAPIEQQLVIVKNTKQLAAAKQLVAFLLSEQAQLIIQQHGYQALPVNSKAN